jgi:uncharacterized membrane protein YvbJ
MNKNLLIWAIIIIVVALTYVGIFFLGRNSVKPPIGKVEIKETVKYDTLTTIKRIFVNRIVESKVKGDSIRAYADSIMADTNDIKYKIFHSISDSQKVVRSWWKIDIEPHLKTITKIVTRDSIETKINNVYLSTPFFLNRWFYATLAELGIIILLIIF